MAMNSTEQDAILLKTLVALAWADGQIQPEEFEWVEKVLLAAGVGQDEAKGLLAEPHELPAAVDLRAAVPETEERLTLLRFLLTVSLADGETSAPELACLRELSDRLEIPADKLEELRLETVG